jgi:integrase
MQLVWSTDDLIISGHAYPKFPILLWDNMESCRPANRFLRYYLLRGAIGSKKSWDPAGRALYDYFSFLQAHELAWDDCDRGEMKSLVAAYRDYSLDTAKHTRSTARNRLTYVTRFYEYAKRERWIATLPFGYEVRSVRRGQNFFSHLDAGGGRVSVRDVMPRTHSGLPKFLSSAEVKLLLAAAANEHHHIVLRLALGSGLRKEELATFPLRYVFDPDRPGINGRNVRVTLDPGDGSGIKTKGSKPRVIYISRHLMKDLHRYAAHRRGERAFLSGQKHQSLFLNQAGSPYGSNGKSLDRIVRLIGQRAGLEVWTHKLRHTYATHTLVTLQRNRTVNRIEPLVFLQQQLGHASIQTTMVYLHLINELADEAVLAYDSELDQLTDALHG